MIDSRSNREPRWATVLVVALMFLFCTAGALLAIAGGVRFSSVKAIVDQRASDGHAEGFTEPLFTAIAGRAQKASLAFLAYGVLIWIFRRRAIRLFGGVGGALWRVGNVFFRALAGYWRRAPAWERWGFVAVMLAGLTVRLLYMQYPLRHDEAWTVEAYARAPVYRLLTDFHDPNNHLLHSLLIHICIQLLGDAEWAIRVPALLAGWLAIAAVYIFFRRGAGGGAGLLAAALLASQSAQIEYSVLARGYSTLVLLFPVALLVVSDWPSRPYSRVRWWTFVVIVALAFCTLLSSLYMFVILCCWFLVRCLEMSARCWPALRALTTASLSAAGLILLFYLPAFIVSGLESYLHSRFLQTNAYYYVVPRTMDLAGRIVAYWGEGWLAPFFWGLVILSVAGMLFHRQVFGSKPTVFPLPVLAVTVCAALTLAQRVFHFPRSFLFLSPLFLGSAACALVWLLTRARRQVAVPWVVAGILPIAMSGVIATRSVYLSNEIGNARDINAATAFLRTQLKADDHVSVTLVSSMPAYYYFRKQGIPTAVLHSRNDEARRLFAVEDKLPPESLGSDVEDRVMSDIDLVIRIDGYDADRLPPRQLLWESQWTRIWLYAPLPRL
jgi:hypothetical protein